MIDFSSLEQSLAAISQIGKGEISFDINGVSLVMRVLTPEEELDVQRTASEVLKSNKEDMDSVTTLEYLDRFRLGTLSYSIVEINSQDFRNVIFIETGDTLPNGKKVQIPKHQAIKKVISKFSRTILVGMFKKYTELVEKTEFEAEKYVQLTVEDLDNEISRLKERISDLETSKAEKQKRDEDFISSQVKIAGQASKVTLKETPPEPVPQEGELDLEEEVARENARMMQERAGKPPVKVPAPNV